MQEAGKPLRCSRCHHWKNKDEYRTHSLKFGRKRLCRSCAGAEVRKCQKCARTLIEEAFGSQWDEEDAARTCRECLQDRREQDCGQCRKRRPVHAFSRRQWEKKYGGRVCEACMYTEQQCEICEQVRCDIRPMKHHTSHGEVRACAACAKCRCAGVDCGMVLLLAEREGVRQNNVQLKTRRRGAEGAATNAPSARSDTQSKTW